MLYAMARSMQKFREIVFQLLYSRDFTESDERLSLVMRTNAIPKKATLEANEKAEAIWQFVDELDEIIRKTSADYSLERITRIEQSVLRLGLYELLHTDLPPKVSITEAVRIAKKYATAEGASFVNALLDKVYKEQEHETVPKKQALT